MAEENSRMSKSGDRGNRNPPSLMNNCAPRTILKKTLSTSIYRRYLSRSVSAAAPARKLFILYVGKLCLDFQRGSLFQLHAHLPLHNDSHYSRSHKNACPRTWRSARVAKALQLGNSMMRLAHDQHVVIPFEMWHTLSSDFESHRQDMYDSL